MSSLDQQAGRRVAAGIAAVCPAVLDAGRRDSELMSQDHRLAARMS